LSFSARSAARRVDPPFHVFDAGFLDGQVEHFRLVRDRRQDFRRRGPLGVEREPLPQSAGLRRKVPRAVQAGQVRHGLREVDHQHPLGADGPEEAADDTTALRQRAVFYARCTVFEDLAYGIQTGLSAYTGKSLTALEWLFPA
jgi:hypothetical protein